jgi:hypothetical protein
VSLHVAKYNMLHAVVMKVEREVQVQHEMWGQNMCIDEMIAFLVFLYCVVVKCSSFSGKYCPHLQGDSIASCEC